MIERTFGALSRYINVLALIILCAAFVIEFHGDPNFYNRLAFWIWGAMIAGIAIPVFRRFARRKRLDENRGSKTASDR